MSTYAVDSKRQSMAATGIVTQVPEWEDKPEGGRRRTDRQARHEETGMPLWSVEVLYETQVFGEPASVIHKVSVGHQTKPEIQPHTQITFTGLTVDANVTKNGSFRERWTAEALDEFTPKVEDSKPGARAATPKEKAA